MKIQKLVLTMNTFFKTTGLALIATLLFVQCSKEETKTKQPNVMLIMVDDMGYSDIGSYGGEIETPHLDKLASNGLRFSNFNNAARCWATRALISKSQRCFTILFLKRAYKIRC